MASDPFEQTEQRYSPIRPRLIVWHLTRNEETPQDNLPIPDVLSERECLLIIDAIVKLQKPIVVLTGPHLMDRPDLIDIVGYGSALGLKMVLEVEPEDLSEQRMQAFRKFGPRTFRLMLDRRIVGDRSTRYRRMPSYFKLEKVVHRLKKMGFELHFGLNIYKPNSRQVAYYLDYAFRRQAMGLFLHLRFDDSVPDDSFLESRRDYTVSSFVKNISLMKPYVPSVLYFSPQCIRYRSAYKMNPGDPLPQLHQHWDWTDTCLAGKSYAFIDETGKVRICASLHGECGDLRKNGYNLKDIWFTSEPLLQMRCHKWSCVMTRALFKNHNGVPSPAPAKKVSSQQTKEE